MIKVTCTAGRLDPDDSELVDAFRAAGPGLVELVWRPLWALDPDVTFRQFRLLGWLSEAGSSTLGELAIALVLDRADIAAYCDDLSRKNLIQRAPSPTDARAVRVELTGSGTALLEHVQQSHRNGIRTTLDRIPPGERRGLVRALRSLAAAAAEGTGRSSA